MDEAPKAETERTVPPQAGGDRPVLGAAWMIGAMTSFTVMVVLVRYVTDPRLNPVPLKATDVAFYRSLVALAMMLPFYFRRGVARGLVDLKTRRMKMFWLRGLLTYGALTTYVYAVAHMVLVDAVALNSTIPLFTAILAAALLRERVGPARWLITVVGFAGALLVLRPGVIEVSWAAVAALVSAALYASTGITVKLLAASEPTWRIVFYTNATLGLISAVPALILWNPPTMQQAPIVIAVGLTSTLAHFCMARAFSYADASFVAPFDFIRLVLITFAGYFLFGETASVWTWVGAIIIFGSAIYLTRSEAKRT